MERRWYSHLVSSEKNNEKGAPLMTTETLTTDNIIICQQMEYRKFAKFDSIAELINFLFGAKFSHNCFYEVIRARQAQKWYTDIDITIGESLIKNKPLSKPENLSQFIERVNLGEEVEEENQREKFYLPASETPNVVLEVKKAIIQLLPAIKDSDILVASSNSDKKHSYHVVIDNWCLSNNNEAHALYEEIVALLPERYKGALDHRMYKSIQQFRLYGSHKYNDTRVKTFDEELSSWKPSITPLNEKHLEMLRLTAFIIMNVANCSYLRSFVKEKPKSLYEKVESGDLDKDTIKEALQLFREKFEGADVFNYLKHTKCFISLKRLRSSWCETCQRSHEHENPFLLVVGENRHIYFDCRRAGEDVPKVYIGRLGSTGEDNKNENEDESDEEDENEDKEYRDQSDEENNIKKKSISKGLTVGINPKRKIEIESKNDSNNDDISIIKKEINKKATIKCINRLSTSPIVNMKTKTLPIRLKLPVAGIAAEKSAYEIPNPIKEKTNSTKNKPSEKPGLAMCKKLSKEKINIATSYSDQSLFLNNKEASGFEKMRNLHDISLDISSSRHKKKDKSVDPSTKISFASIMLKSNI